MLEDKFQVPLADRKEFINRAIDDILAQGEPEGDDDGANREDDEGAADAHPARAARGGKGKSGFLREEELLPDLAEFAGKSHMTRSEVRCFLSVLASAATEPIDRIIPKHT